MTLRALDLFAGAGGLSCGFEWAGGEVVGGVELDGWAAQTFSYNHPAAKVWATDIRSLTPEAVLQEIGPVDIVIGGPMCQGVSQRGPRDPHDERNFAFWTFAEFVRVLRPTFFLMENVPALASDVHNRSLAIEVFTELESLGYHVGAEVLNAAWFGVPQLRYRLVTVGRLESQPAFPAVVEQGVGGFLDEDSFVTVGQAIMDFPAVAAGGGVDETIMPPLPPGCSSYGAMMRQDAPFLFNHWSAATDEINLRRISFVPEGGNWHDIPLEVLPPRFQEVRPSDHTTTYRRLDRSHAAHTITTECGNVTSGAFTHPTQNRAITVREAARLQGFPDRFRFLGPRNAQYRQVGNAVPPLMARWIFEELFSPSKQAGYRGRLTSDLLRRYPTSRLPMTLAPRYKPLFGRSPWAKKRRTATFAALEAGQLVLVDA